MAAKSAIRSHESEIFAIIFLVVTLPMAHAALPIDLEVAAMKDAPFGAMQEWAPLLGKLDLAAFRLRGYHDGDEPKLETIAAGSATKFRILAVLDRNDQLVLPGGRFGRGDLADLKRFLEDLPRREAEKHIERGPFGLAMPQFKQIFDDLAQPFKGSTVGQSPSTLYSLATAEFKTPIELDAAAKTALAEAPKLAAELKGLSAGVVLAAALRSADLALYPEAGEGDAVSLRVGPLAADTVRQSWPVGWKPEKSARQLAPAMYRFTNIEIEGYSLTAALDALKPHMGVPLVFDERVLRRRKIDPDKKIVKFPRGKSYIRRAVDMLLSQASLAGELRIDEAGQPFYWITQWGPDSPRAQ